MIEYDLPIVLKCKTCFGESFIMFQVENIGYNGKHWEKVPCKYCKATGVVELKELEIER